ncbi:phage holin family protein [Sphaerotilus uruguayifluvii]|uniref:Membrane protein n=1 Tax=Sphaerotilus uruguayifluvii TaxID=2735897 RepID=A0ABX2G4L3_9BURK|nr:phage holin family protein [Leptothrix sp. C29]NRT56999.1 putative membrane protein [Leptothrix sp. C29]
MLKLLARWFLLAAALLLVAHLYPGMEVRGFGAALVAALILGLLNAIVRPLLVVLTLPVTIVTLGLFLFIVNAAVFQFAAWMVDGLQVAGFGAALIASLLYSLCGMVIDSALQRLFDED